MIDIVRAQVAHTPRNPFLEDDALEAFTDGAVAFSGGRILACGPWSAVSEAYPEGVVLDARDSLLLPGFVDCHVHYPQVTVIGAMGLELMDWLRRCGRCRRRRGWLIRRMRLGSLRSSFPGLAASGTTTALVFGSHFPGAQEALFRGRSVRGLRVASGLVVSDRGLLPVVARLGGGGVRVEPGADLALAWARACFGTR